MRLPRRSTASMVSIALLACLGISCGSTSTRIAPKAPELKSTSTKSSRELKGRQTEFLVVDRDAHQRTQLEAAAMKRTVVVRYTGCEMEILIGCTVRGDYEYKYTQVNPKTYADEIADDETLRAKIPLGVTTFQSKLHTAGKLYINMSVVGQYERSPSTVPYFTLEGDCSRATHYVAVRSVGAFVFRTATQGEVRADADVWNAEAEAKWASSKSELSRDGRRSACEKSTANDTHPPENFGATIGVTLSRFQGDNAPIVCDERPDGPSVQTTFGWVALGVGAAGAVTFGVTGGLALSSRGKLSNSDACDGASHHCTNNKSDVNSYNLTRTISMVSFPIGIVGLGTGLTLLLTAPSSQRSEVAGVRPWFGIGTAGLEGSF